MAPESFPLFGCSTAVELGEAACKLIVPWLAVVVPLDFFPGINARI